jgi:trk system potassium uptake protein TrkA
MMNAMKKSIAVISLGKFGIRLATSLSQKGFDVIAIDFNPDSVDDIKERVNVAVVLDATDEKAMRSVNVDKVDIAFVAMGTNVQSSLLATALLQKLGVADIYVRSINQLQENILLSMGIPVNRIINIEEDMGEQLSASLVSGKVGRYIQISERHSLLEIRVPSIFIKKTLKKLDIRRNFKVNVVGIKRLIPHVDDHGDVQYDVSMTDIPDPEDPLQESDVLVILGTDDHLDQFVRMGDASS